MAKKLKDVVKINPEPARGTNYKDPGQLGQYSAQNQVAEGLSEYLKAKGINPNFVSRSTKIAHAKTSEYKKWAQDHKFEEVEHVFEDAMLDKYLSAHGINPQYAPKNVKIAHSKSKQFLTWKAHHMSEDTSSLKPAPTEAKKTLLNKAKNAQKEIRSEEKVTALMKFRKKAQERQKKHDELEKATSARHSAGKNDMKGAIDRLEKSLNKEENGLEEAKHYPYKFRATYHDPDTDKMTHVMDFNHRSLEAAKKHAEGSRLQRRDGKEDKLHSVVQMKEEQIDEISKKTLSSYKDKSTASLKNAQANRDASEHGKHMSKGFADLHAKSDSIAKKRVKGLKGYLQRKVGMKPVSEDNFADPNAATQSPFDGANNTDDTHEILNRKREMSKSARIIKSLYKKKGVVKEEIYDHEKDDKNQTSPGKKSTKNPKMEKEDPNALPTGEPKARAVMSGGTTLTGEKRDTVEIDPQMKARPDLNGNKKDDGTVNKKVENK
jgi:hypothetical protein